MAEFIYRRLVGFRLVDYVGNVDFDVNRTGPNRNATFSMFNKCRSMLIFIAITFLVITHSVAL